MPTLRCWSPGSTQFFPTVLFDIGVILCNSFRDCKALRILLLSAELAVADSVVEDRSSSPLPPLSWHSCPFPWSSLLFFAFAFSFVFALAVGASSFFPVVRPPMAPLSAVGVRTVPFELHCDVMLLGRFAFALGFAVLPSQVCAKLRLTHILQIVH